VEEESLETEGEEDGEVAHDDHLGRRGGRERRRKGRREEG